MTRAASKHINFKVTGASQKAAFTYEAFFRWEVEERDLRHKFPESTTIVSHCTILLEN